MCEHHDHAGPELMAGDPFHAFVHEAPDHAEAWLEMEHRLEHATALDSKAFRLARIAVHSALASDDVPLEVELARDAGATREEIASAVLVGLPAGGSRVLRSLPIALAAFDRVAPAPALEPAFA